MMDQDLLLTILKKELNDKETLLLECNERSALVAGESWCNNLVCLDITILIKGHKKELKWMGKFPPNKESNLRFNRLAHLEETEIGFYSHFVPALNEFIKDKISLNLCPVHYAIHEPKGKSFFLMDNLKERGYLGAVGKTTGLDFQHCKILIEELARFHAASRAFILSRETPDEKVQLLMKDFIYQDAEKEINTWTDGLDKNRLDCARQCLGYIQYPGEDWPSHFERLLQGRDHRQLMLESVDLNKEAFNVLIHNDLWTCNLLFKYNSSPEPQPELVTIVDWAVPCWNSPGMDLTNFTMTSANSDVLDNHFMTVVQIYHSTLVQSLNKLGVEDVGYSFDDLLQDYDKRIFWACLQGLTWTPVNLGEKKDFATETGVVGDMSQGDVFGQYAKAISKVILERKVASHPFLRPRLRAIFNHVLQRTGRK